MLPRACSAALAALALAANLIAADVLRVRADQWMPFNGEPGSQTPGYVIEILEKVFPPAGVKLDYANMAWGEALEAAAEGKIDAVIGANRSEAAKLLLPAESIGLPRVGLFVHKSQTWTYANLTSLLKIRLGVIQDYKYWDALDAYTAKRSEPQVVKFTGETPLKDAIAKLKVGEIDALPEVLPAFKWAVHEAGLPSSEFKFTYLHEGEEIFVAFEPKTEAGKRYSTIFSEGIRRLRANGELAKILAKYGQQDWKEK